MLEDSFHYPAISVEIHEKSFDLSIKNCCPDEIEKLPQLILDTLKNAAAVTYRSCFCTKAIGAQLTKLSYKNSSSNIL